MAFISEWTLHENQSVLKHCIFLSVRCKIAPDIESLVWLVSTTNFGLDCPMVPDYKQLVRRYESTSKRVTGVSKDYQLTRTACQSNIKKTQ